ncbi:MAG: transcription antitermination factor NusB, partial [Acidobacteriota bacterium]|nr:transcription antitermination factor NusB [Acidobacteriota bacterium]
MSDHGAQRHRARERALEILYEADRKGRVPSAVVAALNVVPDPYTVALLAAAEAHRDEIEELISRHVEGWTLERLAVVDRLVLTMALAELRLPEPPPRAVVFDEAVELAKTYSTESSGSFVNGVLSACVLE